MPFSLSYLDYVQFLADVQPDTLGLPQWGGIAQWNSRYILMFKMTDGTWALADITGGIPSGGAYIDPSAYLKSVPSYQPSVLDVFIYSIPQNFMQVAAEQAAAAGALASAGVKWTADQVAAAIKPIADSISLGPVLVVAIVLLALVYLPKPSRA